ncbi:hypothetical protein H4R20_000133 [Coemansia guatemalensis]|uniref:C2H2-type domain-containing protein n=1 Tax=Coemansia guatemalensis TaxID=2761395 RepID=A0A9W8LVR1_9FUNG|nr:hypothetical protein H4R20_000133 [Coemansia guatemalensis]
MVNSVTTHGCHWSTTTTQKSTHAHTRLEMAAGGGQRLVLGYAQWTCPKCGEVIKDEADFLQHLAKCAEL